MKKFAILLLTLAYVPPALAVTTLKQVQVSKGSQIDLLFDGKVGKNQIKTEFFNDIIQISLTDVSVYPAKISSVNSGNLTKIFAYQYAPKLVRCRFTVKGKADDYKARFYMSPRGKILTFRFEQDIAESDQVQVHAASAARVAPGSKGDHSPAATGGGSEPSARIDSAEEQALLDRVLKSSGPQTQAAAPAVVKATDHTTDKITEKTESVDPESLPVHTTKLAGGKPLPSPVAAFGKFAAILGILGLALFGAKKFLSNRSGDETGVMGALGRFAKTGLNRKGKMIEVISTHYLGPKKSIAVVRVQERMLVLGITNESINLITSLSNGEEPSFDDLDLGLGPSLTAATPAYRSTTPNNHHAPRADSFAGSLAGALNAAPAATYTPQARVPQSQAPQASQVSGSGATAAGPATYAPSVRDQIKNRLEGLKQL